MWEVVESRDAVKALDRLPPEILKKYALWCGIVRMSGPVGLREVKGFHDEKLHGRLASRRSSRLNDQWRIVYTVKADVVTVYVEDVTPHKYPRR